MSNANKSVGLVLSIIFAAVVVSGSLFYLGFQMNKQAPASMIDDEYLATKIEEGIENFIKKQQEDQQKAIEEQKKAASAKAKDVKPVSAEDHIRGPENAKITLVEYSDFDCPFCSKFHGTPQEVLKANSETVNWVYRHFPLSFHPGALPKAMASECVAELGGNDKFWEYTDTLYEDAETAADITDYLVKTAVKVGVNESSFKECLESGKYREKVENDMADAGKAGVDGTPATIVLNNETGEAKLVSGAQPAAAFQAVIDELLGE